METEGAKLNRADVARVLGIRPWRVASYANPDQEYKIRPSVRRKEGKGQRRLYSLADVYRIALAEMMLTLGLEARIIGPAIRQLLKRGDPMDIFVKQRAKKIEDVRYLVLNFTLAPWVRQNKLPQHWKEKGRARKDWVMLVKWQDLQKHWRLEDSFGPLKLRHAFIMPFDEALADVDARILGRKFRFKDFFDLSSFGSETGPPIPKMSELSDEEIAEADDQIRRENE